MDDQTQATPEPITVGDGANYANLVERSNDAYDDYRKTIRIGNDMESKLGGLLRDTLSPAIWSLVVDALEQRRIQNDHWTDTLAAELGRHLPGLAPALMVVWEHVRENHPKNIGHCCAGNGSFEDGHEGDDNGR